MEYHSSVRQLNDFIEGPIWRDIKYELNVWIEEIHKSLEDPDGMTPMHIITRLQGNAESIRKVLNLPTVLIENIQEDTQRERRTDEEPR